MDCNKEQIDNKYVMTVKDLSLSYGERCLIKGVQADFSCGELVSLIGRNGSGKSTLLRVLAGLNDNYSGEIIVDGDSQLLRSPERARTIAFVNTSRIRIPNMRCADIVALGRSPYTNWIGKMQPEDEKIVRESLATIGMADYAERTLDTMSDGECQRVMIARALAQDTPIILLDEPTSFLDLPNRYSLMQLLADLAHNSNKFIMLSTHELDIALQCSDRIALIDTPDLHVMDCESAANSISKIFGISLR